MTDTLPTLELRQTWPRPSKTRPIVLIGAGGIVNDAHLPAYRKAAFEVAGIFDVDRERAEATAAKFDLPKVYGSLEEAANQSDVVFDVAVPPEHTHGIVSQLPEGAAVLVQKPMGVGLDNARQIRDTCRERKLAAAVNFQLRFAPMMLALQDAMQRGMLGELVDVEFRLNLRTPWELFPFLKNLDRVEIQVHSVHYLDLIRLLLGEPRGVYARTLGHPDYPDLKQTRSSILLDYGDTTRVALSINHNYNHGPRHEAASVTVQGTRGAAVISLGLLLNYPTGKPETLEIITDDDRGWQNVPLNGAWFPDAFIGTMSNMQRFIAGEDDRLISSVDDAYHTMRLVEACYESNARGATPLPE